MYRQKGRRKHETDSSKSFLPSSVRNSLPSNGGPIGPLGSEVQWPLLKLDGPKLFKKIFLTNCLFNLLSDTSKRYKSDLCQISLFNFKLEYKLYKMHSERAKHLTPCDQSLE